jgi:hypothetical protein
MNGILIRKRVIIKYFFFVRLFIIGVFYSTACASTDALRGFDANDFPHISYSVEDINGGFPEAVYIKTRTQTFNTYHYYILRDGLIWYKSVESEKEPKDWTLFEETGLPRKTNAVAEISADADELVAVSTEGAFYRYCFDPNIAHKSNVWLEKQGWPKEEQLYLDRRTAKNTAWSVGKRNAQVLYYEDAFGNQHHNGTMEIITTYMLLEDGQEIVYADTGLPSDFSRNFIGPERGAFKALSLSASASTLFVINEAGEMYTRMADFDIIGADPMWFKYTYIPYQSDLDGTNYFSNLTEWALPSEDWRKQPPIPLNENAAITRRITILQNGQGNAARELRVAGQNENGENGYWTKAIFAETWEFQAVPLVLNEGDFLRSNEGGSLPPAPRGDSLDKGYRGYWWTNGEVEIGWEYEIPDFNILEGSCDFRISFRGETCVLKLYPIEMWTYLKRDYIPGRSGPPKLFLVTLEIPEDALVGLSEDFTRSINDKFAKYDKTLFQYRIAASSRFLILRNVDETSALPTETSGGQDSALFLTDGTLSTYFPELRRTRYISNYDELRRYSSPELVFTASTVAANEQYDELLQKIALNKALLAELKRRIIGLRSDKAAAIGLDMVYIPLHYIVRITPLRFIDAPKIRTMTNYGDKIVLANSAYTGGIADTRIWVDKKVIGLLEVRIKCYEEMAKRFSETNVVSIPAWYSETITGYWDIAGLPHSIVGSFITFDGEELPATLRLHTGEENGELFGWYLSINDGNSFTFFLDPKKSAASIYSRQGKPPEQRGVKINCTLYVNPGGTTYLEQRIIEDSVTPFNRTDREGIDVSINYNGNVFEIRESPPRHGNNTLIFRGKKTLY